MGVFEFGRTPLEFGVRQAKWLGGLVQQDAVQQRVERAPRVAGELAANYAPRAYFLGKAVTQRALSTSKPFLAFGVGFAEEIIYGPNQRHYIDHLPFAAVRDRVHKASRTALGSLASSEQNDIKRGTFAALELAAAVETMAEFSASAAAEEAPRVGEVVAMLPETEHGARVAEQVVTKGLRPVVDAFNGEVIPFRSVDNSSHG